jgi:hypothetical protein
MTGNFEIVLQIEIELRLTLTRQGSCLAILPNGILSNGLILKHNGRHAASNQIFSCEASMQAGEGQHTTPASPDMARFES